MSNGSYYEILEQPGRGFVFRLRSKTSIILATSEPFASQAEASDGIAVLQRAATDDAAFERQSREDGSWTFVVRDAAGAALAHGQSFRARDLLEATVKLTQITVQQTLPTPSAPPAPRGRSTLLHALQRARMPAKAMAAG